MSCGSLVSPGSARAAYGDARYSSAVHGYSTLILRQRVQESGGRQTVLLPTLALAMPKGKRPWSSFILESALAQALH